MRAFINLIMFLFIFSAVLADTYLLFSNILINKLEISRRLNRISRNRKSIIDEELEEAIFKRVFKPVIDSIGQFIIKITPRGILQGFEKRVMLAGKPFNLSARGWVNIQAGLIAVLPVVTLIVGLTNHAEPRRILGGVIIEVIVGGVMPNLILASKIKNRKASIISTLPDILDLLTVSVEAGLGFDGALKKLVEKMPGHLAEEFNKVLQETKVGKPKTDALKDMDARLSVSDITTFIASIIQAEHLGISIGKVLRVQAQQMRLKRKQRAREKSMKAPIKMIIPMVVFIFPTIFTVLMGPAVIRLLRIFAQR